MIRYLILALTTRCNLSCAYCYNGSPEPEEMSESVMDAALAFIKNDEHPFHVQLTGGEPTLVPKLIERAIRQIRKISTSATIGIQTNGTQLTPVLIRLFKSCDVQVGVSLDGPPAVHQILRGKVAETLRGIQLLETNEMPFRVTTAVSQHNVGELDKLLYLLAGFSQARGIGLDLLVNTGRVAENNHVRQAGFRELKNGIAAMSAALHAINQRRRNPLVWREMEMVRKAASKGKSQRFFCHACQGESVAVHPDGRLFPCGQTMGDKRFEAGTVWQPEMERLKKLGKIRLDSEQCENCPIKGRCPGECLSRLYYNRGKGKRLVCELYRAIWETEITHRR